MKDKIALVTGASSGIGFATAKRLAELGARVALVARGAERLEAAAEQIGGDRTAVISLDVRDLAAVETLPQRVVDRFGALDIVINNAGLNHRGPMLENSAAALADVITTNLTAPIALCRAAAPLIRSGGCIVNVASLAGMVPVHHEAAYSASKAGLRAFSRVIRDELRERGITVSIVSPGPVDTSFLGDIEHVPSLVFSQPMSTADDIANAIIRSIRTGDEEIAIPWFSGKLCTLGYVSSGLLRALRPAMERRGERNKREYLARKADRGPQTADRS
ncbi:MAG TPA: SDR family oxidoreductase [Thermoanaerobaculia bacterium]|nr:SDR family oxidoreductase [Thermoanaerobaculia bacterium]